MTRIPKILISNGWARVVLFIPVYVVTLLISSFSGLTTVAVFSGNGFSELFAEAVDPGFISSLNFIIIAKSFEFIGSILIVVLFIKLVDKTSFMSIGLKFSGYSKDFYHGVLIGAFMISIFTIILYSIGYLLIIDILPSISSLLGFFLLFSIVAINEEIVVRGYILNNLMNSFNRYVALSISSLVFMSFHLINPNLNYLAMINLFLAGLLLGIYYLHKKNIWLPIGLHLSWNFFQGPIYGFKVSGLNTSSFIIQDVNGSDYITGGLFGLEGSIITTILMLVFTVYLDWKYKK